MAAVTIRNIPEETHRALKQRARNHGVSTEAEVRAILEAAVLPKERVKFGTALYEMSRSFGGIELDIKRDPSPGDYPTFE
jgi:plasmid stability protein